MEDKQLGELAVFHGNNPSSHAGSVGGVDTYFDAEDRPVVILAAMPNEGGYTDHHLHQGETFELGPELWEVTEIIDPNTDGWAATLTRLR